MLRKTLCKGDFVTTSVSSKSGIVILNNFEDDSMKALISIDEYGGDYISVNIDDIKISNINNYEKLSILGSFEEWFYEQHKKIYQENIINTILYR